MAINNLDTYDKIRIRREELGWSQEQLAEKMGYKSKTSISKVEQKIADLSISKIKQFAEVLGISQLYLLGFVEVPEDFADKKVKVNAGESIMIKNISVSMYGKASAGNGYLNLNDEVDTYNIPATLYRKGVYTIFVDGDSMTHYGNRDSIEDGSVALVDPSKCGSPEQLNGKVCVFTYNDECFIKQLVIDKTGLVKLRSFNPDFEDVIILDVANLKCNGQVIATFLNKEWK